MGGAPGGGGSGRSHHARWGEAAIALVGTLDRGLQHDGDAAGLSLERAERGEVGDGEGGRDLRGGERWLPEGPAHLAGATFEPAVGAGDHHIGSLRRILRSIHSVRAEEPSTEVAVASEDQRTGDRDREGEIEVGHDAEALDAEPYRQRKPIGRSQAH